MPQETNETEETVLTPEKQEEAKELAKEQQKYQALDQLASTEGGKILIRTTIESVVALVESISVKYKNVSYGELMGLAAELEANYLLLKTLTNAKENSAGATARLGRVLRGLSAEPDE